MPSDFLNFCQIFDTCLVKFEQMVLPTGIMNYQNEKPTSNFMHLSSRLDDHKIILLLRVKETPMLTKIRNT